LIVQPILQWLHFWCTPIGAVMGCSLRESVTTHFTCRRPGACTCMGQSFSGLEIGRFSEGLPGGRSTRRLRLETPSDATRRSGRGASETLSPTKGSPRRPRIHRVGIADVRGHDVARGLSGRRSSRCHEARSSPQDHVHRDGEPAHSSDLDFHVWLSGSQSTSTTTGAMSPADPRGLLNPGL
jgi:hypothetical protein